MLRLAAGLGACGLLVLSSSCLRDLQTPRGDAVSCAELQCDDGDPCNGAETCEEGIGCLAGTPLQCDDGNPCNGIETCEPGGTCVAGAPLQCDDGEPCNGIEACDPMGGCYVQNPIPCDDGNFCNGPEACVSGVGCQPGITPLVCNDGDPCNGSETCEPTVGCVAGVAVSCNDTLPCTADICVPADTSCAHSLLLGWCLINNACFQNFDQNPNNPCQTCQSAVATSDWTAEDAGACTAPPTATEVASTVCSAGQCIVETCNPGFADRDGSVNNGCESTELWVDGAAIGSLETGSPADPFLTIQAAVDAAPLNAVITVRPETYNEAVLVRTDGLLIVSESPTMAIVHPPNFAAGFLIEASNVGVRDFHFDRGEHAVHFGGTSVNPLSGGEVSGISTTGLVGWTSGNDTDGRDASAVQIDWSDGVVVRDCLLEDITGGIGGNGSSPGGPAAKPGRNGAGVIVVDSTNCTLERLTIARPTGGQGGFRFGGAISGGGGRGAGILLSRTTGCQVLDNSVDSARGGRGTAGGGSNPMHARGGTAAGLTLINSTGNTISDNRITNLIRGRSQVGSWLSIPESRGVTFGLEINSGSLANDFTLDNTLDGEVIYVIHGADGLTLSDLVINSTAFTNNWGKILVAGSTNVTVRDNVINGPSGLLGLNRDRTAANSTGGTGPGAIGIRLVGCDGCSVTNNVVSDVIGGTGGAGSPGGLGGVAAGIRVESSVNSQVTGNHVHSLRGGDGGGGSPRGNGGPAVGIQLLDSSELRATGNRIDFLDGGDEGAQGGATAPVGLGVGVELSACDDCTASHQRISFIRAGVTGVDSRSACVRVVDSLLPSVEHISCYEIGTGQGASGHGVWVDAGQASNVSVRNSIFSTASGFCLDNDMANLPSSLRAQHTLFFGCVAGDTNNAEAMIGIVTMDPQLVDPVAGDLHLQATSPAVDTGDPMSPCSLEPCPNEGRVNMGAYGNTTEATVGVAATLCPMNCP